MADTLTWTVGHDALGPLLEAAIEEMNRHGPFSADDEAVTRAPRYAALVDGWFRPMSPATNLHALTVTDLVVALSTLVSDRGKVLAHSAVRTSTRTLREADVAVYVGLRREQVVGETYLHIVPDLVVEVLSDSTAAADRGEKKAEYERSGVREYYLLDPRTGGVQAFVLEDAGFRPLVPVGGRYPSRVLGCEWNPADAVTNR